ncbi:MAG: DUF2062 domain-containing protein, partial [Pseudomonadota bacterium]|nr:DUF2062 domain-containing protein [Pseudomonadota bacterium]
MKARLRRLLPSREHIFRMPLMGYFRDHLSRYELWHLNRRSAAGAVAVGFFFAFITPVFQIPPAVVAAYLFRVNIPVTILATFINTPFTFPVVYLTCHRIGLAILGTPDSQAPHWTLAWMSANLLPTLAGALILGSAASGAGYFTIRLIWSLDIRRRWVRRRQRRRES